MASDVVQPTRESNFVAGLSEPIGGPAGKHLRSRRGIGSVLIVVLALTSLTFWFGVLTKAPCHDGQWGQGNIYAYERLCYSDVYALYGSEHLDTLTPYKDYEVEYPVVIGAAMWAAAQVANLGGGNHSAKFFDTTAVMLWAAALVMVGTTAVVAGKRRPWDAAMVAVAPGLIIHGTTNWDLLAAAVTGLALYAWVRRHPGWAGVLLGIGTATKLYPLLFLVPIFALCVRRKQVFAGIKTGAGAVVGFAMCYLPAIAISGHYTDPDTGERHLNVMRFFVLNRRRGADWDSLWYSLQEVSKGNSVGAKILRALTPETGKLNSAGEPALLNMLVALGVVAVLVGVVVLVLKAPRPPRLVPLLFLTLAGFLLVNKVNSPQYTIWLIPLAVLSRPRWGAFLAWQVAEIAVLFTRFYYFVNLSEASAGHAGRGVPLNAFLITVLIRDALLITLMGLVVREILKPGEDLVRADGEDDPAGGVLLAPA